MNPVMRTSGSLTTDSSGIGTQTGLLGYIEANTASCVLYDSTDTSGDVICNVPADTSLIFNPPVQYINGMDIVCAAGGTAVVHATRLSSAGF